MNRRTTATSFRASKTKRPLTPLTTSRSLERAKSVASIFSSIAIPIVLTISGYFIQKQLSSEGIRKDYVGIATSILKESPEGQEPDLRAWAVKVLDENSPVPFSKKAKEGLLAGGVIVSGLPWIGPPEECMKPPETRTIMEKFDTLADNASSTPSNEYMQQLIDFANKVGHSEHEVLNAASRLKCMQAWAYSMEKTDMEFRVKIGAPSSKEVLETLGERDKQQDSQAQKATDVR